MMLSRLQPWVQSALPFTNPGLLAGECPSEGNPGTFAHYYQTGSGGNPPTASSTEPNIIFFSGKGKSRNLLFSRLISFTMAGKEIIVVFGATGAQGNSVACALLQDCTFAVRAVTRDPSKPAAAKLKEAGAEVVAGDLDDEKSLEAALKGAHGAFVVTNAWDHSPDHNKEVAQGKLVADVAKRVGLKQVIYSGLENVKKLTGGKLGVSHFDSKGEVEEYFRHIGCHMTSVRLSFYFENFLDQFKPQKCEDGKCYVLNLPMGDVPLDGISVKDLGPAVVTILKHPSHYGGKNIGLSAEKLTVAQYAHIMSEVTGMTIKDAKIHPEDFEKRVSHKVKHMADMFRFYMMRPERDVALTHKLNPKVKSFRPWLEENKAAFCKECKECKE